MMNTIEKTNPSIFYDFLPNIKFIRTLGQGAFAKVSLIYDQKQKIYLAVKKISLFGLCQYQRKMVLNEAKILSSIQHPNIIRFHSCLYDNSQENVYIFMEYAKEGDLLNLIFRTRLEKQQIKQKIIWKIISDVAQALNYLHSNNIIHRDVKPANILQQGDAFKLADMNVSKIKEEGKLTCTNVGTPLYTSPQVARHEFYNEKCDIWSLAVVVYELCCFKNPFTKASIDDIVHNKDTQTKDTIYKIPLRYSKCLSNLIKRMLVNNPKQRITINEILHICQNQGMPVEYISSKQKIAQFKTIVFPSQSQRWVNLVAEKKKKKDNLDLTIDEILKESELKEISFELKNSLLKTQKESQKQNKKPQKDTLVDVILDQDEYCLSNIKIKKRILKTSDRNIIKVDNFLKKQIENLSKPTHRVLNQKMFFEPIKPRQLYESKSISTDKRRFHRQRSQTKDLSHSRDKHHSEYGFKFIKLSKNLEHLHS